MLAMISLGILALTLNWFDVATAFPLIGAQFKVGLGPLSLLISLYIVGYGLTHIPGGMLATAIGMKKTLVLGLLVQGLAGIMSGLSHSYAELAFFRVVSGVGGSVFIAVGIAAVVVWFRDSDVTLALGISGGAVFSAGAAFALYVWVYVQRATSWHTSLILAGVFELLVMLVTLAAFRVPDGDRALGGSSFDRAALRAVLSQQRSVGLRRRAARRLRRLLHHIAAVHRVRDPQPAPGSVHWRPAVRAHRAGRHPGQPARRVLGRPQQEPAHVRRRTAHRRRRAAGPHPRGADRRALGARDRDRLLPDLRLRRLVGRPGPGLPTSTTNTSARQAGLMLTLAAVGGFFIPIIFGHLVPRTSFDTGWVFLAIVSFAFALLGLAGRNPAAAQAPRRPSRSRPAPSLLPGTRAGGHRATRPRRTNRYGSE